MDLLFLIEQLSVGSHRQVTGVMNCKEVPSGNKMVDTAYFYDAGAQQTDYDAAAQLFFCAITR